ncbi:hypothetical protein EJ04DRAFT_495680 [Polyplosphaeria fusca]|uniref:Uncharacterized protein n=1 Tax=Polyplosphaeria fusca TaxID=682080 RepID=A0A9P4UYG8_9PLEO|nr:hypothetical protein EJ04DRAFT_495680 [Polyplosphaeria fusca]
MSALPASIPRFLLPRGPPLLRPQTRLAFPLTYSLRYASTAKPKSLAEQLRNKKPATLAQPDKWRPPSHGKMLPRSETAQRSYGPKLTEDDKERMRTKKYPNMMAPEGSFMYWFLNNRAIHLWITMGILLSLGLAAWYMDYVSKSIYNDLMPTKKDYLHHPITSMSRFIEVYKMHIAFQSQKLAEQRLKKAEEVEKRRQYRLNRIREAEERGEEFVEDPRYYIGEDGIRRRRVKRWFGIWE